MALHGTIVGAGVVGRALNRRLESKKVSTLLVNKAQYTSWIDSDIDVGDFLIFAVSDARLQQTIADIAKQRSEKLAGVLAIHVCGFLGKEILEPLSNAGALIAAAHPFQTFGSDDPTALDGISWGVESTSDSWLPSQQLIELLGGRAVRLGKLSSEEKLRYHAAAVAASNFVYAGYELARSLANDVGIDPLTFLMPIMQRTFENAADALHDEEPFAITGPVSRGNAEAVERQLNALPDELRAMYALLSKALLEAPSIGLSEEERNTLKHVLNSYS